MTRRPFFFQHAEQSCLDQEAHLTHAISTWYRLHDVLRRGNHRVCRRKEHHSLDDRQITAHLRQT